MSIDAKCSVNNLRWISAAWKTMHWKLTVRKSWKRKC